MFEICCKFSGIEEVVIKIFRDSEPSTIKPLTSAMKNSGIKMAVELKYFESESFEEMDLDDTKINKIMAFVQESWILFHIFQFYYLFLLGYFLHCCKILTYGHYPCDVDLYHVYNDM